MAKLRFETESVGTDEFKLWAANVHDLVPTSLQWADYGAGHCAGSMLVDKCKAIYAHEAIKVAFVAVDGACVSFPSDLLAELLFMFAPPMPEPTEDDVPI